MTNFVQIYKSTDLNAPVLTGTAGDMTTLLDAVLVNGYTTASVTSIVESGVTYTVTLAVANSTLAVGDHIKFSGASPAGINDVFTIVTITSTTVFTFTGPGSLGAITGTILYRKAPLAWDIAFTGTNKRAYRSADATGNRFYLRADDSNTAGSGGAAKEVLIRGYETMTSIDTGTGLFPGLLAATVGTFGVCWAKSSAADATARPWCIVGDNKTFYIMTSPANAAATAQLNGFGHFISYKAGDGFNTFVVGCSQYGTTSITGGTLSYCSPMVSAWNANSGLFFPRGSSQIGSSPLVCYLIGTGGPAVGILNPCPNSADNSLWMMPVLTAEASTSTNFTIRGRLPGLYNIPYAITAMASLTLYDKYTGLTGIESRSVVVLDSTYNSTSYKPLVDVTGPWT
jgi:hypothetical protein